MIIQVDVAAGRKALEEPEDCKAFHVQASGVAEGALDEVAAALGDWAAGGADGHVWVSVAAVRAAAAGRVGPGWDADFDGMVAYASTKGWLNATGDSLQAHVVWS